VNDDNWHVNKMMETRMKRINTHDVFGVRWWKWL